MEGTNIVPVMDMNRNNNYGAQLSAAIPEHSLRLLKLICVILMLLAEKCLTYG